MRLGITEILLILVLALVIFGGSKLSGVGKALGQSIREFKRKSAARRRKPHPRPPKQKRNPNNALDIECPIDRRLGRAPMELRSC